MTDTAATLLSERYQLLDILGRGGMADVYRGHDQLLDRPVAIKMLRDVAATPEDRARFTKEAQTLAALSHPGLVMVLDAGTYTDRPYLVLELVDGPTLAECCRGVALEPARVGALGAQLADALGYVHSQGVVHRDVKPANVLLGSDDRVRLTDFGIARLLAEAARHTATGDTIGTAAYLSPEQVRGDDVTSAADVYSLGLVLLEALTGERAYGGAPMEAALARLSTPPVVPDWLPPPWHELLRAMTALDPGDRPAVAQVAAALRALAAGVAATEATSALRTATLTMPPGALDGQAEHTAVYAVAPRGGLLRRPAERRPSTPALVGAAVLLVLALLVAVSLAVGGRDQSGGHDVPNTVPAEIRDDLQDLHDAVNG